MISSTIRNRYLKVPDNHTAVSYTHLDVYKRQDTERKIRLLLDYTDRPGCSIADPWYSGNFEDTYRDVDAGCEGFLAYLKEKGAI